MTTVTSKSLNTHTLRLALLDLSHEWILTLCMVLALAAVLAPLLILLGLKQGAIETMRQNLVGDPVNREIRPAKTLHLSETWFSEMRKRPDIQFVIPSILYASSIIRLSEREDLKAFDLIPTAPGDPLILDNGGRVPQEGECTLSHTAAKILNVTAGNQVTAYLTRNEGSETVTTTLKVISVLPPRAGEAERVYMPINFVNDVEAYRHGLGVPHRGWAGGSAIPPLSYDGVWVLVPLPLSPIDRSSLTLDTGLSKVTSVSAELFEKHFGFSLKAGYYAYQCSAVNGQIYSSNLTAVKEELRGKDAIMIPFTQPLELRTAKGESLPVIGLSLTPSQTTQLGLPALPWEEFEEKEFEEKATFAKQGPILLPTTMPTTFSPVTLTVDVVGGKLSFSVTPKGQSFSRYAIVPTELIGVLRTGKDREITFDSQTRQFLLTKPSWAGFRLYTHSIDDVPRLYQEFLDQEIAVQTPHLREIQNVKQLDQGLGLIFWLVAIGGIVGGIAALIANLYASVERKKRDISVLRLIGFSRLEVFQFPIYQGLTMAILSVTVAIAVYALLSTVINILFAKDLQVGQQICTLPLDYFLVVVLVTTAIAACSSLLAAWKTTQIDPAEALREE